MSESNPLKITTRDRRGSGASLSEQMRRAGEVASSRGRSSASALNVLGGKAMAEAVGVTRLLDGIGDLFMPRDATATVRVLVDSAAVPLGLSNAMTDPVRRMLQGSGLTAAQMLQDSGVSEAIRAATNGAVPHGLQHVMTDPVRRMLQDSGLTASQLLQDSGVVDALIAESRLGLAGFRPVELIPRPVERPLSLQTRRRRRYVDEVDEFLYRVRPDLVGKRRATLEDLDRSPDPLSQAACSGAELIIHLFCELVPDDEVRRAYGGAAGKRPPWADRLLLLRAKYGFDAEASAVIEHGILHTRKRLEDIKHDSHLHTRCELEDALGDLQRLLLITARAVADLIP